MNRLPILHALSNDDSILDIEMGSLAKNMNKEVCGVINSFLSFLTRYDEKKIQKNVLALMLNLRFKNSKLISSFIGCEQRMTIVEKYDNLCFLCSWSFIQCCVGTYFLIYPKVRIYIIFQFIYSMVKVYYEFFSH